MITQEEMTVELFNQFIKEDKWISCIAKPVTCCDKYHKFSHYRTLSYPVEYIITEEQINKAKELYAIRKAETLASISKGELAFYPMGGDFKTKLENGVGNYRIICHFKNSVGHNYSIELCGNPEQEHQFYVDFSVDQDLLKQRELEMELEYERRRKANGHWQIPIIQDYYNCFNLSKQYQNIPFTFKHIVEFINRIYGCTYNSARLIHYFAKWDEWCCECQ